MRLVTHCSLSGHAAIALPSPALRLYKAISSSPSSSARFCPTLRPLLTSRRSVGRARTKSDSSSASLYAAKSSGIPSRTIPSLTGRATTSRASCASARIFRAYERSRSPSSVNVACFPFRCSSGRPTCSSSRLICWLTVDCVRCTRSPALVNPPASTTETQLRRRSMSIIGLHSFEKPLIIILSFNFQMYRSGHTCCGAKGNSHAHRPAFGSRCLPINLDPAASRHGRDVLHPLERGFRRRQSRHRRLSTVAAAVSALPGCRGDHPWHRFRDAGAMDTEPPRSPFFRDRRHRQSGTLSRPGLYRLAGDIRRSLHAHCEFESHPHRHLGRVPARRADDWRKAAGLLLGFGGVAFIVSHRLSLGGDTLRESCSRWRVCSRSSVAR